MANSDHQNIISDRNIAQWLAEGDESAQKAAADLAKQLIHPFVVWQTLESLSINTELMLTILKSIMTNPEASDTGRISAIREIRGIMRDASLSARELNKHFKLEDAVADTLRKKVIDNDTQEPAHVRQAKRVLDSPFRMPI